MPSIRELPPSVVNKIAAGEVIERPASVVKELVENAIDAAATRIDIALAQGGRELIRVADDGGGIPADELPLAVASHATSKIADADDLFRIHTFGFRGEALASIAAVSRLRLRSRAAGADVGAELEVVGGEVGPVVPAACPAGTVIEISQLFFNTPVRRKFLRTTQTEMGHVAEAFTRVALAWPRLHLRLEHNDRLVYELPASTELAERIALFFGWDLAKGLIWVESEEADTHVWGYVAHPAHSRADRRMQYIFLNGRYIQDRSLGHALGEAYRGLLMTQRYPIAFLFIEMPPEQVDVNVHPTKLEVRFQDGQRLYSQVLGTLRRKFLASDLTTPGRAPAAAAPRSAEDEAREDAMRQQVAIWAKEKMAAWTGPLEGGAQSAEEVVGGQWPAVGREERRERRDESRESMEPGDRPAAGGQASPSRPSWVGSSQPVAPNGAIQVYDTYLVAETPEGMVVIDQHALHERVLYEELRERVLAGRLERQPLLVPEPVDLTPGESAALAEHREVLLQLGLELEEFGGGTVLVRAYPAMLANLTPAQLVRDVADHVLSTGRSPAARDLLDALLHMVACKAAVKAGDRLAPGEIAALLERRHLVDDAHHCPHGRPTALVFTRAELERQFGRT